MRQAGEESDRHRGSQLLQTASMTPRKSAGYFRIVSVAVRTPV